MPSILQMSVTVEGLEVKAERRRVYNLKVEGTQNYFVGKNRLLVHNGGDCVPNLTPGQLVPRDLRTLAEAAFDNPSNLAAMTAEQRAAAQGYEAIAQITKGPNAGLRGCTISRGPGSFEEKCHVSSQLLVRLVSRKG